MIIQDASPSLEILRGHPPSELGGKLSALLRNGAAAYTLGGFLLAGFPVEALKSLMTGDARGRWWFIAASVVGVAVIAVGWRLRRRARRQARAGIVVAAPDGPGRDADAVPYSLSTYDLTLVTKFPLTHDSDRDPPAIAQLAKQTRTAMGTAQELNPDAAAIHLIPFMRLHAAFCFGANLKYNHDRNIWLDALHRKEGTTGYFPAVRLRVTDCKLSPLEVLARIELADGDPAHTALAIDLQGLDERFFGQVREECVTRGIGLILRLRLRPPQAAIPDSSDDFGAVVDQVCRFWKEERLPEAARIGQYSIFLTGPPVISVALGARLAGNDQEHWTAFTWSSGRYEGYPVAPVTAPTLAGE